MSDEPRTIRAGIQAARDRRTVPSFNDDIGDAIERDALAALDRLESQNQALQERIQDLAHDDLWGAKYVALQEALERAWKHEDECHAYCSAFSPALERSALSPTQETDPE